MSEAFFQSSDTGRGSQPLKYLQTVTFDEPLRLEQNGTLQQVTVAFETYGTLNEAKDNAVLICHALSGDSHIAAHDEEDDAGWWDIAVGPGKAIDTDKYFVICPNVLGGCRGTTGPNSINPATGRPYGQDFPVITMGDMVEVQKRLVDHFGIDKLLAVVGGSMGGHQVLTWAVRYPDRTRGIAPIATSARLSSQALAFDVVGRNAICRDPNFHDGQYYDKPTSPEVGLAIARMIGHITYLSREAMQKKFESDRNQPRDVPVDFEKKFSVGSYLGYKGAEFVERFDANSYVTLTMAMDLFDLGATVEELRPLFEKNPNRWLTISFTSDWLFSPEELQIVVKALVQGDREVSYCNVTSNCGHDAFLLQQNLDIYGELVRAFLGNLSGWQAAETPSDIHKPDPSSIFHPSHPHRLDYQRITELIPSDASVLDLGCGNGELLSELSKRGHKRIMGVELDQQAVVSCVQRGLNVIHTDLNKGLEVFRDKQFDCVVLSRTLQAVLDVEKVIEDILRVGKQCIVSFPNFGYYKLRDMLYTEGKAPEAPGVLQYSWYDTPNIRFLTIADFEEFCAERSISVHRRIALDTEQWQEVTEDPNRSADLAIFVISR